MTRTPEQIVEAAIARYNEENPPDIIEAAVRALQNALGNKLFPMPHRHIAASVVITAVTPLIRAAALERAASMVERDYDAAYYYVRPSEIAAAIRALKEKP